MARKADRAKRERTLADGWTIEADHAPTEEPRTRAASAASAAVAAAADAASPSDETDTRPQLSNGMMIMLGVFGGLYLAYVWIWFSWAEYMVTVSAAQLGLTSGALGAALQTLLYWLAPLAPAIWFIAALRAHRGGNGKRLAVWLIIGALVLVPLPYLMTGSEPSSGVFIGTLPLWGAL